MLRRRNFVKEKGPGHCKEEDQKEDRDRCVRVEGHTQREVSGKFTEVESPDIEVGEEKSGCIRETLNGSGKY